MSTIEDRLAELGTPLPQVTKPVAAYVPAVVTGNLVFTSGQLPLVDGAMAATGKVGDGDGLTSGWPQWAHVIHSARHDPWHEGQRRRGRIRRYACRSRRLVVADPTGGSSPHP